MNTSNGCPRSSSVMLTYIVPSGVSMRRVVPRRVSGRERFCRRWRFSASRSCSAFLSRSISARTSASSPWRSATARLAAACPASRSARASDLPLLDGLLLHLLRRAAGGEHLLVAPAVAIHRDALAVELVRQPVDLLDVLLGGVVGEVGGLGDRRVAVLLEGGLHPDVPLGRDVVRGDEHALPLLRHLGEVDVARLARSAASAPRSTSPRASRWRRSPRSRPASARRPGCA